MARKMLLSDRTTFNIIECVKQYPQLWNHEHVGYKNRFHSAVAWKSIAASLQLPENVLKVKWRNLRDTYKKEIKKFKVTNVDEYSGKWQFFQAMTFTSIENDEDDDDKKDDTFEFVITDDFEDHSIQEQKYLSDEKISNTYDGNPMNQTNFKENYDVLFLKSLVPYFKELDPMRKLVMRNKIQELLLNELAINSKRKK